MHNIIIRNLTGVPTQLDFIDGNGVAQDTLVYGGTLKLPEDTTFSPEYNIPTNLHVERTLDEGRVEVIHSPYLKQEQNVAQMQQADPPEEEKGGTDDAVTVLEGDAAPTANVGKNTKTKG